VFEYPAGTSDKAQGLRSAVHQYMAGSETQTYSIMADSDCLGKLIAGLVTKLSEYSMLLWSCCLKPSVLDDSKCLNLCRSNPAEDSKRADQLAAA